MRDGFCIIRIRPAQIKKGGSVPLEVLSRDVQKEYLLDMSPTPTKRVAIYARVSTFDKGQDPETQLLQLREYAQRRGFDVAGEYVDYATGTNEDRPN